MTMTADGGTLDETACWRLLTTVEVGRLSYTESALPVIRPVPYVVDRAGVVVALSWTVVPAAAFARPVIVAFEAGVWVPGQHQGWSVQLVGRARAVSQVDAARFVEQGLSAWVGGGPAFYVAVSAGVVTGRRLSG